MPDNPLDSPKFAIEDIIDWAGLCEKLGRGDENGSPNAVGRVMVSLSQNVQEAVRAASATNNIDESFKAQLVADLNQILKLRNFAPANDVEALTAGDATKSALSRNRDELSDGEIELLNRLMLEATFPEQIRNYQAEPYVGPRSFQKTNRYSFFGRDDESDELVSLITAHPAVLLYSQSGAGKTSLLNAQLIPKLEEDEHFQVLPPMRVQGQLSSDFKIGKKSNIFVLNALMSCIRAETVQSDLNAMTFAEFLKGKEKKINPYGEPSPTVLIFDQFEELFTSYPGRWPDRETFFKQLGDALEGNQKEGIAGDPFLRVVFCMREDYVAEMDPYVSFMPEKLRTRFRLEHLREKKALAAVTRPLEKTKRTYAKGVAEQLVKNLLKIPSQSVTGTATIGLYVEPVQLQVVCQTLWEALEPGETVITKKHLAKYGDVTKALADFYERSIKSVCKDSGVKEETLRSWFEDKLISSEGTRAPINRGNDLTGGMENLVIDKLESLRLIKGEWKGTNVRWYELAHDRFIEPIRRSNESWLSLQSRVEQIRLRLENKASKWQPGTSVLDPDELLEARRLVRTNMASKPLQALVVASRASANRRRARLYRFGVIGLLVVVVLFAVVAYYAWQQNRIARSRLLASRAAMQLKVDPELSVLLAREAIDKFYDSEEAEYVIRNGLLSLSNVVGAYRGHTKSVTRADFSPDGKYVLTTSEGESARLWDVATGKLIAQLGNDKNEVADSTFAPDGKLIVTAESEGRVREWDGGTGTFVRELQGHSGNVNRVIFSPDGNFIATASDDKTARIWNAVSGETVKELKGQTDRLRDIAFSPDGTRVAVEALDGKGRIWDLRSDKYIELNGLNGPRPAIAFSPDGKLLATDGGPDLKNRNRDGTYQDTEGGMSLDGSYPVTVWDVATGKAKFTLDGHKDYISGVAFSPDGEWIVTCSGDHTARLWKGDGRFVSALLDHTSAVTHVHFSPDSKFVVTSSADNTARVWDVALATSVGELRGHSGAVNSAAFSPDGQFIVTASDDKTARLWRLDRQVGPRAIVELTGHSRPVNSAAYSPDGTRIVTAGADGRIFLKGITADKPYYIAMLLEAHEGIAEAAFSPDGKIIAATTENKVLLWNAALAGIYLRTTRELTGHENAVNGVAFSPDSRFVVTASSDKTARVWEVDTGMLLAELRGHTGKVNSAAFSPDGKLIITASDDATVRLWDASNYMSVGTLEGHTVEVYSAQYSPDGRLIVTASADGVARVWNADTKQLVFSLAHSGVVNSASFSPDSKLIVTASADKTARVWNAQTGKLVAALRGHLANVLKAVFSPDGKAILTASADYTAMIYPADLFTPFDEVRKLIPKRITRELTPGERKEFLDEALSN